jgi:ParB family chromosome partitioning protein
VGRSRAAVTNLLRLLDLTEDVQQLMIDRKLDMGHARALLPLSPTLQREAAHQVLLRGLSAGRPRIWRAPATVGCRTRRAETGRSGIPLLQDDLSSDWERGCRCGMAHRARAAW